MVTAGPLTTILVLLTPRAETSANRAAALPSESRTHPCDAGVPRPGFARAGIGSFDSSAIHGRELICGGSSLLHSKALSQ